MAERGPIIYGRPEEGPWVWRHDDRYATGNWSTRTNVPDADPDSVTGWKKLPSVDEQRKELIARGILKDDGSTVDTRTKRQRNVPRIEDLSEIFLTAQVPGFAREPEIVVTRRDLGTVGELVTSREVPVQVTSTAADPTEAGRARGRTQRRTPPETPRVEEPALPDRRRRAEIAIVTTDTLQMLVRMLVPDLHVDPRIGLQHIVQPGPGTGASREQTPHTGDAGVNTQKNHTRRRGTSRGFRG